MENFKFIRHKFPKQLQTEIQSFIPYGKATIKKIFKFLENHCLTQENYICMEKCTQSFKIKLQESNLLIKFLKSNKNILPSTEYKLLKSVVVKLKTKIININRFSYTLYFTDQSFIKIFTGGLSDHNIDNSIYCLSDIVKKKGISYDKVLQYLRNFVERYPTAAYGYQSPVENF